MPVKEKYLILKKKRNSHGNCTHFKNQTPNGKRIPKRITLYRYFIFNMKVFNKGWINENHV